MAYALMQTKSKKVMQVLPTDKFGYKTHSHKKSQ